MAKMKLKKGDEVVIIAGTSKGTKGKILSVDAKNNRVIVEGANMITKHQKARTAAEQGGLIHQEAPIDASNVMYLHEGVPTRLGTRVEDGKKVRFAKKSENKEAID